MSLFHCPYCKKDLIILRQLSTLASPLKGRKYALYCKGKSEYKPHSPVIAILEVTSIYKLKDGQEAIKNVSLTIFQVIPPREIFIPYGKWLRRKKPQIAQFDGQGPPKKSKNDPNIAPFKCLVCLHKGEKNDDASHFKVKDPRDRVIAYECNNDDEERYDSHKSITFYVKRIRITRNFNIQSLPFDFGLFKYESWESWMLEKFKEYSYDGGVFKVENTS